MRRKFMGIPLGVILSILLIPAVVLGGMFAFHTITGEVEVHEIFTVTPDNFTMEIWPGDTLLVPITIENHNDLGHRAYLTLNCTPPGLNLTLVDYDPGAHPNNTLHVGPNWIENLNLSVYCPLYCPPGAHTVTVTIERGDGDGFYE